MLFHVKVWGRLLLSNQISRGRSDESSIFWKAAQREYIKKFCTLIQRQLDCNVGRMDVRKSYSLFLNKILLHKIFTDLLQVLGKWNSCAYQRCDCFKRRHYIAISIFQSESNLILYLILLTFSTEFLRQLWRTPRQFSIYDKKKPGIKKIPAFSYSWVEWILGDGNVIIGRLKKFSCMNKIR